MIQERVYMHYYKYRPPQQIYFKELLYNELYFTHGEECNDPYDSKAFFLFEKNLQKWERLFNFLALDVSNPKTKKLTESLAPLFFEQSPMSFHEMYANEILKRLSRVQVSGTDGNAITLQDYVRLIIKSYMPPTNYFVSFSRVNNEPLLWSHYADSHRGYCLIFKAIDGGLRQDQGRKKTSIQMHTPFGVLSQNTSFSIPNEFKFEPITYISNIEPMDAFMCFPDAVWNEGKREVNIEEFISSRRKYLFQKAKGWSYEKESRVCFEQVAPWLSRKQYEFSPHERLLYYDPTQLVGIVLGAKISEHHENQLYGLIKEHQDRLSDERPYRRVIFDFALFRSHLTDNRRVMDIRPESMFSLSKQINKGDKDFQSRLDSWERGEGLEFNNGCRGVTVK